MKYSITIDTNFSESEIRSLLGCMGIIEEIRDVSTVFDTIRWSREDVESALEKKGLPTSDENVDKFIKSVKRGFHETQVSYGNEALEDLVAFSEVK